MTDHRDALIEAQREYIEYLEDPSEPELLDDIMAECEKGDKLRTKIQAAEKAIKEGV